MNKADTARAARLFELLAGRTPKDAESQLFDSATSFSDFRLRLVAETKVLPGAASVLAHWKSRIERASDSEDVNELMHSIELLTAKQDEIERRLREKDVELLDRLRDLDVLTTSLADIRREARMVRRLMANYRQAIVNAVGHKDEVSNEAANAG